MELKEVGQYVLPLLIGLSAAGLIWGGRDWLRSRFQSDVAWMRDVSLRFDPHPVDPRRRVLMFYGLYLALLIVFLIITPHPFFALVFWFVLLAAPKHVVQWAWKRRRNEIDHQLAATIAAMANSIRAGLTLVQAIQRLSENAPEPIRTEFKIMINRYTYGASLESTIREAKERLRLPNFNLFASALLLNREMGGDVSQTLTRISLSLDKLHQMRQTVEAHTSEGRTNIKVLAVMPFILLLMLSTVEAEAVLMLFTTSAGYALLLLAGGLMGAGIYFSSRIVQSEI